MFCLSSRFAQKVPVSVKEREALVASALGERKVLVPNISCSWEEFKACICKEFPKLSEIGGFEILRCIPNSKTLEKVSTTVSHSPQLLRSVVGNGKVYIRPIQRDIELKRELIGETEVNF